MCVSDASDLTSAIIPTTKACLFVIRIRSNNLTLFIFRAFTVSYIVRAPGCSTFLVETRASYLSLLYLLFFSLCPSYFHSSILKFLSLWYKSASLFW